jgi:hypothetical protein
LTLCAAHGSLFNDFTMNPDPFIKLIRRSFVCLGAMLLCSCSTVSTGPVKGNVSVRKVDYSDAPEMKAYADRARQIGNEMYPKVCALLADGNPEFPQQFDIYFKKHLADGHTGETSITWIRIDAENVAMSKDNPGGFEHNLIHGMAHVAQHYYQPIVGRWLVLTPHPPACWEQGIADYVAFKLGETNCPDCPQCGYLYPHYRDGYVCAGAFLLYLDHTYNSNIVRQLNTVLRQGGYTDEFFARATGKNLPELWAEFQKTSAFTPRAARMLELRQALGFINGKPPRNLKRHFDRFIAQHADALMKDSIKYADFSGKPSDDLLMRMAAYLYFTQPGGSAEAYLINLKKENKVPGFSAREHGQLTASLTSRDLDTEFPTSSSFTSTKQGDSSTYHYVVFRASLESAWKLQRAWRTTPDGKIAEDYPVP